MLYMIVLFFKLHSRWLILDTADLSVKELAFARAGQAHKQTCINHGVGVRGIVGVHTAVTVRRASIDQAQVGGLSTS